MAGRIDDLGREMTNLRSGFQFRFVLRAKLTKLVLTSGYEMTFLIQSVCCVSCKVKSWFYDLLEKYEAVFFYPIFLFSITETGAAPGKAKWKIIPLSYNVVLLHWSSLFSWRDCCAQGTFLAAKPSREAGGEPNLQAAPS